MQLAMKVTGSLRWPPSWTITAQPSPNVSAAEIISDLLEKGETGMGEKRPMHSLCSLLAAHPTQTSLLICLSLETFTLTPRKKKNPLKSQSQLPDSISGTQIANQHTRNSVRNQKEQKTDSRLHAAPELPDTPEERSWDLPPPAQRTGLVTKPLMW